MKPLKIIYEKLFKINDTPQRVAVGFGLGVCLGIFPGTGVIAALFMALVLRVNRAAALIGCLVTNTWLSFVTFILAANIGGWFLGIAWQDIVTDTKQLLEDFTFKNLFQLSVLKVTAPLLLGYLLIGIVLGILAYLITLIAILGFKKSCKLNPKS